MWQWLINEGASVRKIGREAECERQITKIIEAQKFARKPNL